jgi:TPP-dependent pyruvate/acetoin dehydrogenase alpha subunit
MIGSAAALGPEDVITCQYRETGMFLQRGFTLKDFMSQLTANHNDPGKGRNMPVHYSGKLKVGAVRTFTFSVHRTSSLMGAACRRLHARNTNPPRHRRSVRPENEGN